MMLHGGWSALAGNTFLILSSITQYASALAISRTTSSAEADATLPFATAATYNSERVFILPSGKGVVVDSTKTIDFEVVTDAVYTLHDGCVMTALKEGSSVIMVPGKGCSTPGPSPSGKTFPSSGNKKPQPETSSIVKGSNSAHAPFSIPGKISTSGGTGTSHSGLSTTRPPVPYGSGNSWIPKVALGTPSIVNTVIVESGTSRTVPVIVGGSLTVPITLPPVTTTLASAQATSSVSSVSSEIAILIPMINSWKANPTVLKIGTLGKITGIRGDIDDLISNLGGKSSSSGCGSKKRGFLSFIGNIVNSLTCIDKDLENIKDNIESNTIDGIKDALDDLISENDGLKDGDNDDDNNNSKSESNSDSQSKSDNNSRQSGSSTKSSTASSTSSCASTETALHITVLCKPTTLTTLGSTVTTTTCSPSTTVTTHGCSVTAFTTTISSTTSANATRTPCSPGTCGAACHLQNDGPLSGASMVVVPTTAQCALLSTITTSALPTGSYGTIGSMTIASPTPQSVAASAIAFTKRGAFGNPATHMYNETMTAGSMNRRTLPEPPDNSLYVSGLSKDLSDEDRWSSQAGITSGIWYDYATAPEGKLVAGLNGLYGCTAVMVVSEKGVYISHIWEHPVFISDMFETPTTDAFFTANSFNVLRDGNQYAESITTLKGTADTPGPLNCIYAPKVVVITPFTDPLTDSADMPNGVPTKFQYQNRAQKLAQSLVGILPGSEESGLVFGYDRYNRKLTTTEFGYYGKAILEVDPKQTWLTTPHSNSKGVQIGRWRLWVGDKLGLSQDFFVPPTPPSAGSSTGTTEGGAIQQRDNLGYPNPCGTTTYNPSRSPTSQSSAAKKSGSMTSGSATKESGSSPAASPTTKTGPITSSPITSAGPHSTDVPKTTSKAPTFTNFCYPFADPDAGPSLPLCQCDGMNGYFLAMTATTDNLFGGGCQFTTPPTPSPTAHSAFTQTQSDGLVLSCASSTYFNYAVYTVASCAGSSKVISTVSSLYSVYTASVSSVASASRASVSAAASSSSAAAAAASATSNPLASCHTSYKFLWDTFDIYGHNWDESKLDAGGGYMDGNGLLTQLRGCSSITHWAFAKMTMSTNQPYQWHASGRTTIWQKTCIEHAMISAGAPTDSCQGSG